MKYPRTLHLTFSPGASSDDKVTDTNLCLINIPIVITEKLDGSNFCISHNNCHARSCNGPPTHKSFDLAKSFYPLIKNKIPESIFIYMEYCYAQHSIHYNRLNSYFNVFGVFDSSSQKWLSWEEVGLWANEIDVPTVPTLFKGTCLSEKELKEIVESLMETPSICGDIKEGVVVRVQSEFKDRDFSYCAMKYVRKNHVQTTEHWKEQEIIKNKLLK